MAVFDTLWDVATGFPRKTIEGLEEMSFLVNVGVLVVVAGVSWWVWREGVGRGNKERGQDGQG